jgi:hypothetical protein
VSWNSRLLPTIEEVTERGMEGDWTREYGKVNILLTMGPTYIGHS